MKKFNFWIEDKKSLTTPCSDKLIIFMDFIFLKVKVRLFNIFYLLFKNFLYFPVKKVIIFKIMAFIKNDIFKFRGHNVNQKINAFLILYLNILK